MSRSMHSGMQVWREGVAGPDRVAEEVPVALHYNGRPHVVMMCTPADLEDFARGFTVTEEIVAGVGEMSALRLIERSEQGGYEIDIAIPEARAGALERRQRNLQGRSGCGLCGVQTLEAAVRPARRVPAGVAVRVGAIRRALDGLHGLQPLNAETGATHAAAWASPDGLIVAVREDVGRHNALDKLVGRLLAQGQDVRRGFCLITSRASVEMVQKAAAVGMPMLVAISAPTALAVRVAEACGMTLVGFARGARHVVYTCPDRLSGV